MKNRTFISIFFLSLFIPATFLLCYGERIINKTAKTSLPVLLFADSENTLSAKDFSALEASVENPGEEETTYLLSIQIDDQDVHTKKITVPGENSRSIEIPREVTSSLLEEIQQNNSASLIFKVTWQEDTLSIKKQLFINEN